MWLQQIKYWNDMALIRASEQGVEYHLHVFNSSEMLLDYFNSLSKDRKYKSYTFKQRDDTIRSPDGKIVHRFSVVRNLREAIMFHQGTRYTHITYHYGVDFDTKRYLDSRVKDLVINGSVEKHGIE